MSELVISGLGATVGGKQIIKSVDLKVASGEVHAVMGPNGAGKSTLSHVLLGKPGYEVTGGTVTLDGADLLQLPTWERAQAGLFLAMQQPTEVPGVQMRDVLAASLSAAGRDVGGLDAQLAAEAKGIGFDTDLLTRPLNVDLSGGEKKRSETIQLSILNPKIAIIDELDSGLDVDGLTKVARRVEALTNDGLGVLVITHFPRLLTELNADQVHVLAQGRIMTSGGPELAVELEQSGYAGYAEEVEEKPKLVNPFADPFA